MSEDHIGFRHAGLEEIIRKIRVSIAAIAFVIVMLVVVILKHLAGPVSQHLDFIPDASVGVILAGTVVLTLVGLYYAVKISRQMVRIIRDYGNRLERMLSVTRDLREEIYGDILLEKIMDAALTITNSDAGSILLMEGDALVFKIVKGEKAALLVGTSVEIGKGVTGWVASTGQPLRITDVAKDDRFNAAIDAVTGFSTKSILCVPLKTSKGIIGVLELLNKRGGFPYRERDEEIIGYLAEQAAISIIKTRFYEDQKNYEIHLTEMLLEAIDYHIPEKRGHSRRVARYSNIIAKGLNMTEEEKKNLYFACLLHDVGFLKIHTDDAFKREEYMRHPALGYEMIKPINFYSAIAPVILHHHERFDGYGYPSQLKGEDIPLEARIIHIAEAFDAMISPVSYRVPVSFTEAVEELRRKSGSQFDQELVDILVNNIEPQQIKP